MIAARTEIRRTKLGFVFQKFNLLPALTARQNLEVARKDLRRAANRRRGCSCGGHPRAASDRGEAGPQAVGAVRGRAATRGHRTSSRPIGRPSCWRTSLPGALDTKNSEIVLKMFQELNKRLKQTILLVTHNPELAAYTNRLIEMRDGLVASPCNFMKRHLLWTFDRGSFQWDILCCLILAFLFLIPRDMFNDVPEFMKVSATEKRPPHRR